MSEPSIVAALKAGFKDPRVYYGTLQGFGGDDGLFFDRYLNAHIVVGYQACQAIYRSPADIGRARLAFPDEFFADCDGRPARAGYEVMKAMSVFQNADAAYTSRRKRLLETVADARKLLAEGAVAAVAARHCDRAVPGSDIDWFTVSLRDFAVQCANLALLGRPEVPEAVTADALTVAYFFDGKRLSRPHVLDALDGMARLGDWIASELSLDGAADRDLIADLVLLYVAAHESLAYLLYTCLTRFASEPDLDRLRQRPALEALVAEAMRYDAPVQMSGRVALKDVAVGETAIRAGDKLYLHVGAANRDGRVFEQCHDFIEGRPHPHLAFGWGPTRCVGSEYAGACAIEYLSVLLSRFTHISHDAEQSVFDHGLSARGLKSAVFTFR